ncbi:MAG: sugar transferase [Nocardioides sp.]|uniref:sugar transferase n=1 Tax=Nocardioides sp. TaxID=35761 RepID=UPI0039E2E7BF
MHERLRAGLGVEIRAPHPLATGGIDRRRLRWLPHTALVLDAMAMLVLATAVELVRRRFGWFTARVDGPGHTFWLVLPLVLAAWLFVIAALGGYRERHFGAGIEEYKIVLNATLVAAGVTGVGCYLVKLELSRSFYLLVYGLGVVVLMLARGLLRHALHRARSGGALCHGVVIAGPPTCVAAFADILRRESWLGYRVRGALVPPEWAEEETIGGTPVLGTLHAAIEALAEADADVLLVTDGALDGTDQMRELVWELEDRDVQVVIAPSVTDVARERVRVRPVAGLPLVHIDAPRTVRARRHAKRVFDLSASVLLLLAMAPFFGLIAAAIKLYDGGPVFFRQVRVGRDGDVFWCLKFRTMVAGAEQMQPAMQAEQGHAGALWKMKADPRITAPGRMLRRFSLDELPQLINVVRGDMSLVGPRPQVPAEVATYDRFARRRLHVRPGMTGLWQVSGRSDLPWDEAVRLDLYYVDNWSMMQDVGILAKTFGAVFGAKGAY